MADLFHKQADKYAETRPSYPPELFRFIASKTPNHKLAWDVGTGSGQAAVSGLIHFLKAQIDLSEGRSFNGGSSTSTDAAAAELQTAKDHAASLERQLAEAREDNARMKISLDFHAYQSSLPRVAGLENRLARQKQESDATIAELRQEKAQYVRALAESREFRARVETEATEVERKHEAELARRDAEAADLREQLRDLQNGLSLGNVRYNALLHHLALSRQLYLEIRAKKEDLEHQVDVLNSEVVAAGAIRARNALLEEQVAALENRLLESGAILTKIITEARRVDPNAAVAADEPSNLLLHEWQADEILLKQRVAEAENQLPTLMLDRINAIEEEGRRRMQIETRRAYYEGKDDEYLAHQGDAMVAEAEIARLGTEIDDHLQRMIAVLGADGANARATMLQIIHDALETARSTRGTRFFPR